MGCAHLSDYDGIHRLAVTVTRQHHERLDGSGYRDGLVGKQIDPVSRICTVVDSFDAMTALRPFKKRALAIPEALGMIKKETPQKYDPDVVKAWLGLMDSVAAGPEALSGAPGALTPPTNRRVCPRYAFNCPVRLHVLDVGGSGLNERPGLQVVAHNISQSGLGVLSRTPVTPGETVRVYLHARTWNREYLEARVIRCRSYRDGWFEIGVYLTGAVG